MKTNILIVGNGFDLSHYLPTKYEHFMVAMTAIQQWDESKGKIGFDDLFCSLYEQEDYFFGYTKAMYKTEHVNISIDEIKKIKKQLEGNIWFKFFFNHITQIDTWIDFELEFSKALDLVANFSKQAKDIYKQDEKISPIILEIGKTRRQNHIQLGDKTIESLCLLGILVNGTNHKEINQEYYRNKVLELDVNSDLIIKNLENNLNDFIKIFDWYLLEIVEKLDLQIKIEDNNFDFKENLTILSFNYTNTFRRIYDSSAYIEYVHGNVGKELVLGISDLKNEFLKKFKNYSFTKYHQKLLKKTDYLFLRANRDLMSLMQSSMEEVYIYIWGHSLADSDESYIRELFSFNEGKKENFFITVYFHDNDAPRLLNNLLDNLGKAVVETWMKNLWLKFEKNPNIAEIYDIKPVELPKAKIKLEAS